uniref:Uncharacterized protein n=1 Tax=Trichogramma kaykai TaxID=54128 RepID=A0ABD2WAR4_9HYME
MVNLKEFPQQIQVSDSKCKSSTFILAGVIANDSFNDNVAYCRNNADTQERKTGEPIGTLPSSTHNARRASRSSTN